MVKTKRTTAAEAGKRAWFEGSTDHVSIDVVAGASQAPRDRVDCRAV